MCISGTHNVNCHYAHVYVHVVSSKYVKACAYMYVHVCTCVYMYVCTTCTYACTHDVMMHSTCTCKAFLYTIMYTWYSARMSLQHFTHLIIAAFLSLRRCFMCQIPFPFPPSSSSPSSSPFLPFLPLLRPPLQHTHASIVITR